MPTYIAQTLEKNADAVIAAASKIKKSRRDITWNITLFGMGALLGALFLAAYPITEVTKSFYVAAAEQEIKMGQMKERYESNSDVVKFLNKHHITIRYGKTDDSWDKKYLQNAPYIYFDLERARIVDEISGYKRIVFRKE